MSIQSPSKYRECESVSEEHFHCKLSHQKHESQGSSPSTHGHNSLAWGPLTGFSIPRIGFKLNESIGSSDA